MKIGQKLTHNGVQCAGFPMEYLCISQGCNGLFSHMDIPALDLTGKDGGIDPTIAITDCHLVFADTVNAGHAIFMESDDKVLLADGTKDYIHWMSIHDDYIGDIIAYANSGKTWKQGQTYGDEGTEGMATGNHCHFEVAKGKFPGRSMCYVQNSYGLWQLRNSVRPDKLLFVDGSKIVNNGNPLYSGDNMKWKTVDDVYGTTKKETKPKGDITMVKTFKIKGSDAIYFVDLSGKMMFKFANIRECQFVQNLYKANNGTDIPHDVYSSKTDANLLAMLSVCKQCGITIPKELA